MNFSFLSIPEDPMYYYIYCISDDAVVHLPFKRDYEKQTGYNCPINKKYLDCSSYWIEDVACKLMCKYVRDNGLNFDDFKVLSYKDSEYV